MRPGLRNNEFTYHGLRGYKIASETIFGPIQCFSEARRQSFTWMPFCPLGRTPMVSAFRSCSLIDRKPHPSQMKPNCPFVRTESCWKEDLRNSFVALFAAILQVSTWYLCASGHCDSQMMMIWNQRCLLWQPFTSLLECQSAIDVVYGPWTNVATSVTELI